MRIRSAGIDNIPVLVDLVQRSFNDVAERVSIGIIADDNDLKSWYAKIGFVESETKGFKKTYMEYEL